jgi:hypothetical protein
VLLLVLLRWQIELAEYPVATVPSLRVEHVEGEELVLHANVHQSGVFPENTLVAVVDPEAVLSLQSEGCLKEWVVVLVASAKNDSVSFLRGAVDEVHGLAFYLLDQGLGAEAFGPIVSQRLSTVAKGNIFAAVFPHLGSNIFSRVGSADDDGFLASEFKGIFEVMRVQDSSTELLESLVVRDIWD